jgi:hypothetical protein
MVATGSGRPALGGRVGTARSLGAQPTGSLGLPLRCAAVAVFTLVARSRWVGMARRLGSRRYLGALSRRLGLPLAVAGFHQRFLQRPPLLSEKEGHPEGCPSFLEQSAE